MQRAVVSGITGHLGKELARQLVVAGVEVSGLTRQEAVVDQSLDESVRFHRIDGQMETLIGIFNEVRPDAAFHLAGLYRREHQSADIDGLVETNILFGTQMLEATRLAGCPCFVTAGSYFQHFDTTKYRALNLYAATKQAFEDVLAYYVDAFDISAVRLTLCDIYSEHDTRRKLITDIANAWSDSVPLNFRDEEVWIDPVHVEDAAAAFVQAAGLVESDAVPRRTLARYSVSCGRNVTSAELVALFERLGGRKLTVTRGKGWHLSRRMKPWRGDRVPGWEPRVTLEHGIARILAKRQ
jgi:nucleoside-diphosphate-sugar epimerase